MNSEKVQGTNPDEKPLFVLRYTPERIAWRLFWPFSLILPLLFYAAFFAPAKKLTVLIYWFYKIVAFIFVVVSIYLIYDMLAMKGVYLYADRVIKRYRSNKDKVVLLKNAQYDVTSNAFEGVMRIYDENTKSLLRGFEGIYIDEKLAAQEDVKRFRELLVQISGRTIKDLRSTWSATKLMVKKEDRS